MARKQAILFIPTQPVIAKADRTSQQIGALLGSVASIAQIGIQTQLNAQNETNERSAALLKVRQLGLDEKAKASKLEQQEAIRDSQRTEQAATQAQRSFDKASAEIERTEKMGIFGVVNGMTESQLRTANAKGLGFTTPSAVMLADQAIGQRQANLDFPRLLDAISADESKLPSEHLKKFLSGRDLKNDTASLHYANLLTNNLKSFERSAILSRAKKTRAVAFQNAIDGFQFQVVQDFDILDKETFAKHLGSMFVGLKEANPNLSDTEFRSIAVETLKPLFVGSEARFGAANGLLKINQLFTPAEAEAFGLGGVVAQLEKLAAKDIATGIGNSIKNANSFAEIEQGLVAIEKLSVQGIIGESMAREFRTDAQKQIQKVRANEEVNAVIDRGGRSLVPLTSDHDDAIDLATDSRGLVGTSASLFQVKSFGRLTERTINQIDALTTSIDGREVAEGVAMWTAIYKENPSYAYDIATSKDAKLPEKLAALALDTKARGIATLSSGAAIPESIFDEAANLYDDPNKGKGRNDSKVGVASSQLPETGIWFWGQVKQTVANPEQQRAFRSIAVSHMARARTNGETDTDKLYTEGTAYANKQIAKLYTRATLAGETYAVRSEIAGIFNQTSRSKDNVDKLAKQHMRGVQSLSALGEFRFDFRNAELVEGNLIVPVRMDGETINREHWFTLSLSPIENEEALNPKVHPFNDPNRAFNSGSSFPAIGRFLYGSPDEDN